MREPGGATTWACEKSSLCGEQLNDFSARNAIWILLNRRGDASARENRSDGRPIGEGEGGLWSGDSVGKLRPNAIRALIIAAEKNDLIFSCAVETEWVSMRENGGVFYTGWRQNELTEAAGAHIIGSCKPSTLNRINDLNVYLMMCNKRKFIFQKIPCI